MYECVQGKNCTFSHDCEIIRKPELCKFYLLSTCTKGLACPYYHDILSVHIVHLAIFLNVNSIIKLVRMNDLKLFVTWCLKHTAVMY